MRIPSWICLIICGFALVLMGCGGGDVPEVPEPPEPPELDVQGIVEEALKEVEGAEVDVKGLVEGALQGARKAVTGGREVEPVDYRTLQALLPTSLAGMERVEVEGSRDGAMGFFVSTATATYRGDVGRVKMAIIDLGGVTSPAMMGFGWTDAEVDRSSREGYERTTEYKGRKAYEKYRKADEEGEMAVVVADRFIVAVDGEGLSMDRVKDALDRLDMEALEGMRDAGVKEAE